MLKSAMQFEPCTETLQVATGLDWTEGVRECGSAWLNVAVDCRTV